MGDSYSEQAFVLLGINPAGAAPAMELILCATPDEAVARAKRWLRSHSTCVRVQVWDERDNLLADIEGGVGAEADREARNEKAPPR